MTDLSTIAVGDELPALTVDVDRARLIRYAGASGDFNVIHWDERFATAVGLPDVIAHGMWTMGAAGEIVARWIGDASRITGYSTRFSAPVPVPYEGGAQIDVTGVVKSIEDGVATVDLTATSGGAKVLAKTSLTVSLR
ncbi:MaoC/PaaZ C-terminal domain-containing protein [Branchiibius sp. NY16-3462-2]|uniref:MaoC/PaaZ C-terminal domain-containing protein n=1 Tax=Branchiibius sp. NY16-3462-2 TaxID=1807500 RepID=UPI000797F8D6|nr:MaoC/PaaZ C-terminal domain-containing protein [Branchiibius sp. NY16-3462-2]KYH46134.1 acyl dehydratase [Branchiibius sp. NY16-3462-2]